MARSRDIRLDIRDRLLATGEFSDVQVTGPPEERGIATIPAVAWMAVPTVRTTPRWDGGARVGCTKDERLVVTLAARDLDPQARDEAAERLAGILEQCVNGQSLAGITVPDHTYVEHSRPLAARSPERRIEATVTYQYVQDGWGTNDTSP